MSSDRALAKASSPQGYQSTGLPACCSRYGLVSLARRFIEWFSYCTRAMRRRSPVPCRRRLRVLPHHRHHHPAELHVSLFGHDGRDPFVPGVEHDFAVPTVELPHPSACPGPAPARCRPPAPREPTAPRSGRRRGSGPRSWRHRRRATQRCRGFSRVPWAHPPRQPPPPPPGQGAAVRPRSSSHLSSLGNPWHPWRRPPFAAP